MQALLEKDGEIPSRAVHAKSAICSRRLARSDGPPLEGQPISVGVTSGGLSPNENLDRSSG